MITIEDKLQEFYDMLEAQIEINEKLLDFITSLQERVTNLESKNRVYSVPEYKIVKINKQDD